MAHGRGSREMPWAGAAVGSPHTGCRREGMEGREGERGSNGMGIKNALGRTTGNRGSILTCCGVSGVGGRLGLDRIGLDRRQGYTGTLKEYVFMYTGNEIILNAKNETPDTACSESDVVSPSTNSLSSSASASTSASSSSASSSTSSHTSASHANTPTMQKPPTSARRIRFAPLPDPRRDSLDDDRPADFAPVVPPPASPLPSPLPSPAPSPYVSPVTSSVPLPATNTPPSAFHPPANKASTWPKPRSLLHPFRRGITPASSTDSLTPTPSLAFTPSSPTASFHSAAPPPPHDEPKWGAALTRWGSSASSTFGSPLARTQSSTSARGRSLLPSAFGLSSKDPAPKPKPKPASKNKSTSVPPALNPFANASLGALGGKRGTRMLNGRVYGSRNANACIHAFMPARRHAFISVHSIPIPMHITPHASPSRLASFWPSRGLRGEYPDAEMRPPRGRDGVAEVQTESELAWIRRASPTPSAMRTSAMHAGPRSVFLRASASGALLRCLLMLVLFTADAGAGYTTSFIPFTRFFLSTLRLPSSSSTSFAQRRNTHPHLFTGTHNPFGNARDDEPEFVEWGYGGMGSVRNGHAAWGRVQGGGGPKVNGAAASTGTASTNETSANGNGNGKAHAPAVGMGVVASGGADEDEDDGTGMGWVRRRREAREREKREREEREAKEKEGAGDANKEMEMEKEKEEGDGGGGTGGEDGGGAAGGEAGGESDASTPTATDPGAGATSPSPAASPSLAPLPAPPLSASPLGSPALPSPPLATPGSHAAEEEHVLRAVTLPAHFRGHHHHHHRSSSNALAHAAAGAGASASPPAVERTRSGSRSPGSSSSDSESDSESDEEGGEGGQKMKKGAVVARHEERGAAEARGHGGDQDEEDEEEDDDDEDDEEEDEAEERRRVTALGAGVEKISRHKE
ncbi:hypothetical protein DFH09DRAFT_1067227 [Mycena vulgaris]|nr:hypothetical protein DFH09DRAFT_1067227 [Mycena vulgaris]